MRPVLEYRMSSNGCLIIRNKMPSTAMRSPNSLIVNEEYVSTKLWSKEALSR